MVYCKSVTNSVFLRVWLQQRLNTAWVPKTLELPKASFQNLQRSVFLPFTVLVIPHNIAPTATCIFFVKILTLHWIFSNFPSSSIFFVDFVKVFTRCICMFLFPFPHTGPAWISWANPVYEFKSAKKLPATFWGRF